MSSIRRRVPALQEVAMDGSSIAHIESEERIGKQSRDRGKPPLRRAELAFVAISDLKPDPRNPRKHDRAQIRAIASSIEAFGFNAPILIDKNMTFSRFGGHRIKRLGVLPVRG